MGEDKAKYVHLFLFPSYRVCTILRRKTYFHQNVLAIWKNLKELERKSLSNILIKINISRIFQSLQINKPRIRFFELGNTHV